MLERQEGVDTAMSLQGEDALALVNVLDRVSGSRIIGVPRLITPEQAIEVPNISPDLRKRSIRILRRICGSQSILPRSCVLLDDISKEGVVAFASNWSADVWKGHRDGNLVCIKTFCAHGGEFVSMLKEVCSQ